MFWDFWNIVKNMSTEYLAWRKKDIFYRNMSYAIFKGRETRHQPSLDLLEDLMLDDLERKYAGKRVEKYINSEEEQLAIDWFRKNIYNW